MESFRVAICVPSTGMCRTGFASSLCQLVEQFPSMQMVPGVESQEMTVLWREGSSISSNRHSLWKQAKEWGASHLFFLDEDLSFSPIILQILASRQEWCVGANYPMRSEAPYSFTALHRNGNDRIVTDDSKFGLEACRFVPMGCTLIEMGIFDRMSKPFWVMAWNYMTESYTTEDAFFFAAAQKELGLQPFVDHDASKLVGHIGLHTYTYEKVLRYGRGNGN